MTSVTRFLLLCAALAALPVERAQVAELQVEVNDGLLSVNLGDVPVDAVLREIGQRAGFVAKASGDLGRVRAQTFQGVPLAQGIRRLIGSNRINLLMRYETDATGKRRLAQVHMRQAREVTVEEQAEHRKNLSLSRATPPPSPPPGLVVLGSTPADDMSRAAPQANFQTSNRAKGRGDQVGAQIHISRGLQPKPNAKSDHRTHAFPLSVGRQRNKV